MTNPHNQMQKNQQLAHKVPIALLRAHKSDILTLQSQQNTYKIFLFTNAYTMKSVTRLVYSLQQDG